MPTKLFIKPIFDYILSDIFSSHNFNSNEF